MAHKRCGKNHSPMVACALLACVDPTIMTQRPPISTDIASTQMLQRAKRVRIVKMEHSTSIPTAAVQTVATMVLERTTCPLLEPMPGATGVPDSEC